MTARERHVDAVVLGHPVHSPRFGCAPVSAYGIRGVYDAPDGVFLLLEMRRGALRGRSGTVE